MLNCESGLGFLLESPWPDVVRITQINATLTYAEGVRVILNFY